MPKGLKSAVPLFIFAKFFRIDSILMKPNSRSTPRMKNTKCSFETILQTGQSSQSVLISPLGVSRSKASLVPRRYSSPIFADERMLGNEPEEFALKSCSFSTLKSKLSIFVLVMNFTSSKCEKSLVIGYNLLLPSWSASQIKKKFCSSF